MTKRRKRDSDLARIVLLARSTRVTLFHTPRADVSQAMRVAAAANPSRWIEAYACAPAVDAGTLLARYEPTAVLAPGSTQETLL